ncbi:hypothetical protein [Corynebacterium pseudodiphtheriticum]|uniref:Uncharacterized protein n=1 Tax=Corynebacterium pseudodiphtheriticum TaxID=37637 RepID=A0ABT7FWG8_9CORY|nr:hypothetical protein [Corynebacterium pseudodiphtheriticum]ERJ46199.1 hypothetical protein N579_02680 [Corynebacterium pseudodiphtheriticum 090104]MDC7068153.1 hypothetical protein [Corynebacterium pseudodiphtheriticum]MDC7084218.1 hypothetical protein [Corynebacterium pseudodiphtheriticum]MDC7085995.1 hypothetical protein [Corynebacterium pseudodiphtheriticum]MDK4273065.1 hypothetical protein [Corynebacterium pseudodiphtheriticum]
MDTATTTADNSDAHAEDDLENHKLQLRESESRALKHLALMSQCSVAAAPTTQKHVETLKEAFDKLQAQVLALRIRGEETCLTCSTASDLALPRMRGEEHGKVSVKLYQHALGQTAAPAQTMVPAARSRAEWMDKLRPFELVRRQTQH